MKLNKKLTDEIIRGAHPKEKDYKLFDGNGLYLLVTTRGTKLWRMKYRFEGNENNLSFGNADEVSLMDARYQSLLARNYLKKGMNPAFFHKKGKEMNLNTPIKILKNELKHLEGMREKLDYSKRELEDKLDDINFDLNELCTSIEGLRLSIKQLEGS